MPLTDSSNWFTHGPDPYSFLAAFSPRMYFFRSSEPAQRFPGLKTVSNVSPTIKLGNRTALKSQFNRALDRFSAAQRREQRVLFMLDPAEVHGEINPVNNKKDLLWLKSGDTSDFHTPPLLRQALPLELAAFSLLPNFY